MENGDLQLLRMHSTRSSEELGTLAEGLGAELRPIKLAR